MTEKILNWSYSTDKVGRVGLWVFQATTTFRAAGTNLDIIAGHYVFIGQRCRASCKREDDLIPWGGY